jgi:hypothetical protein
LLRRPRVRWLRASGEKAATAKLDATVDAAYSKKKFAGDSDRVAFLFELYQQILSPLEAKKNIRRKVAH